jgi:hypothetical protein
MIVYARRGCKGSDKILHHPQGVSGANGIGPRCRDGSRTGCRCSEPVFGPEFAFQAKNQLFDGHLAPRPGYGFLGNPD